MIAIDAVFPVVAHSYVNVELALNILKLTIVQERNISFNAYHDFVKMP